MVVIPLFIHSFIHDILLLAVTVQTCTARKSFLCPKSHLYDAQKDEKVQKFINWTSNCFNITLIIKFCLLHQASDLWCFIILLFHGAEIILNWLIFSLSWSSLTNSTMFSLLFEAMHWSYIGTWAWYKCFDVKTLLGIYVKS